MGKFQYYVYRYQGKINGIAGDVVVIISWPKDAFGVERALKAFICTGLELPTEIILKHYCCRWPIEVFIRQTKMLLGLNKYQMRKDIAFKRYWLIIMLCYTYIASQAVEKNYSFSSGLKVTRRNVFSDIIFWVHQQGKNGVAFESVVSKVFKKPA